jgi:RNA polymerase sigma-70 factor (ECF subfamily)
MAQSYGVDARVRADHDTEAARSDVELIAAINSGDAAAFEVLYRRHRDWVAGLACRFTGDSDASLDVMQETFLYFLRKFPGFRLTANLKTFLYPAVRHLAIAARQKAARYQATAAELEQLDHAPAPPATGSGADDLQFVLAALPEEQREVLLLRFVDGLSLAEVAAAMDIPLGTVKSRLHNALETLRQDEHTRNFFER